MIPLINIFLNVQSEGACFKLVLLLSCMYVFYWKRHEDFRVIHVGL